MTNKDIEKLIINIDDFPKPGVGFKDISGILRDAETMKYITKEFAKIAKDADIIVGPDARGFLFGVPLAMELGIPFVMVRKPGKLPGEVIGIDYELEYSKNRLEVLKNSIKPGQKVYIVDDLLATGGTAKAIVDLMGVLGAKVMKSLFVIELTFLNGNKKIQNNSVSLVKY